MLIENIIVFGSKKCSFCEKQLNSISNNFDPKIITFLDLENNNEALVMAKKLSLEYIPCTVIVYEDRVIKYEGFLDATEMKNRDI